MRRALYSAGLFVAVLSSDEVSRVRWNLDPKRPLNATKFSGVFSTGKAYNATAALIQDGSRMSVQLPYPDGCAYHEATSVTAIEHGCQYATNAGFFDFPPAAACEGALIINGTLEQWPTAATNLTFVGVSSARKEFVFGYSDSKHVGTYQLDFLVSGRGWLVRGGKQYVNSSREWAPITPGSKPPAFVSLWAPRTSLGVRADGTAIMAVVDGIEGSSGPDLWEMAELMLQLGAQEAINLDGGGSSTAVLDGKLFNDAHCSDTWDICQRNVTSVICAAYPE